MNIIMHKMTQPTGEVPSLDTCIRKEYIHGRLGGLIPADTKSEIDYGAVIDVFGIGCMLAFSGQEKNLLTLTANCHVTPAIRVTMYAAPAVYDLGYDVGQALRRSVDTDLQRDGQNYAALSNFATTFEAITVHVSTFFYPDTKIAEIRRANRSSPLGRLYLPPDEIM